MSADLTGRIINFDYVPVYEPKIFLGVVRLILRLSLAAILLYGVVVVVENHT